MKEETLNKKAARCALRRRRELVCAQSTLLKSSRPRLIPARRFPRHCPGAENHLQFQSCAEQSPLGPHFFQARERPSPNPAVVFDLSKHWLDDPSTLLELF